MRLYFANLAKYNEGTLQGKWYDLDCYSDATDLMNDVEGQVCDGDFDYNEWAIHDYECPFKVSENPSIEDIQAMIDFAALDETDQKICFFLINYISLAVEDAVRRCGEVTFYKNMSLADVAETLVFDGCFGDIPKSIVNYIDYEAIARDLEHDGYVETEDGVFVHDR